MDVPFLTASAAFSHVEFYADDVPRACYFYLCSRARRSPAVHSRCRSDLMTWHYSFDILHVSAYNGQAKERFTAQKLTQKRADNGKLPPFFFCSRFSGLAGQIDVRTQPLVTYTSVLTLYRQETSIWKKPNGISKQNVDHLSTSLLFSSKTQRVIVPSHLWTFFGT